MRHGDSSVALALGGDTVGQVGLGSAGTRGSLHQHCPSPRAPRPTQRVCSAVQGSILPESPTKGGKVDGGCGGISPRPANSYAWQWDAAACLQWHTHGGFPFFLPSFHPSFLPSTFPLINSSILFWRLVKKCVIFTQSCTGSFTLFIS